MQESMEHYSRAAGERAMKVQEVILQERPADAAVARALRRARL